MTRHRLNLILLGLLLVLASFVFSNAAMAQQSANLHDPSGSFTGLLDLVRNNANQWNDRLTGYATTLFWLLAGIQLIWTFFPLVFRQADFSEIVGELIRFILVIGFFYALLENASVWGEVVVQSFRQAGAHAVATDAADLKTSIRPGDIFDVAVQLAKTIGDIDTWNPLAAFMVTLASTLVLLCFAFIAAFMGLTIIESYVVINAAVLFTGFGGSQWTRDYALAIVRYALAVSAKLFVLTLLIGHIIDSSKAWQTAYKHDDVSMWTMVGLALACAYICKTLPELVAGMISSTSMGGGGTTSGMAAASAAGAAGAAAAIGTIANALGAGGTGGATSGGLSGLINASLGGASGAGRAASSVGLSGLINASLGGASGAGTSDRGAASKAAAPRIGGAPTDSAPDGSSEGDSSGADDRIPSDREVTSKAAAPRIGGAAGEPTGSAPEAPDGSSEGDSSGADDRIASDREVTSKAATPRIGGAAGEPTGSAPDAPDVPDGSSGEDSSGADDRIASGREVSSKAATPRVDDTAGGPTGSAPDAPDSSSEGGSSDADNRLASGKGTASKAAAPRADDMAGGPTGSTPEAPDSSNEGGSSGAGDRIASGAQRTAHVLSAISVPGMENAAGPSTDAPQPGPGGHNNPLSDMGQKGVDNTIHSAEVPDTANDQHAKFPGDAPGGDVPTDDKGGTS
ncbi:P-type conjugative transfer protein TrbL [Verminephrobacter aporrectodeae subsp. tuberculatae]|uniref:P-type conjugative transfer protein TrbL n=1 Tax=Verminephrobacter aporrectodeae TaxID=1110389 RepID=UPI0022434C9D|nr:P-type conjugative transfer protein TrbL [Verminephrobacter aporrectodeae]MCW8164818.1 P-type conjugative transfer protein TrbL [Verminephrobacter aporrectodeae subsp. tuberculatae]MCW8169190.1 P-type conjugative transfer protein TrbL [Verminephrobacter aporrectodeae subsp. tuberculatae]